MSEKPPMLFQITLTGSEVNASCEGVGEFKHQFIPLDPATTQLLLKLFESRYLRPDEYKADEWELLCQLGLVRDYHLVDLDEVLQIIGSKLFAMLFPYCEGDQDQNNQNIRGALDSALKQQPNEPLLCQLRFDSRAVDLACLPWELIRDEDGPLVASKRLRLTRYITFGKPTKEFPIAGRLGVLVVQSRPTKREYLPREEESLIQKAFTKLEDAGLLRIKILPTATLEALVCELNRQPYHVLHFDGHGGFVRRCPHCDQLQRADLDFCPCGTSLKDAPPFGCLSFEIPEGGEGEDLVKADKLATILENTQIRLVVVSACQSAMLGGSSVFSGLGPRLIEAGIPAVVGMQFSIPADDASVFVDEFYKALAGKKSIAAAIEAGRLRLFARSGEHDWKHGLWYIPTLYLRNKDGEGHLFRFSDSDAVRGQKPYEVDTDGSGIYLLPIDMKWNGEDGVVPGSTPYRPLRSFDVADKALFHGRDREINDLFSAIVAPNRRCALLSGPAAIGKTSLVNAGLIPKLLENGSYLVLTVRNYGDPVERLREALHQSQLVKVELIDDANLPTLVDQLLRQIDRPLLFVFDEFDQYLTRTAKEKINSFFEQVAICTKQTYPLPVRFLFVLHQEALANLAAFEPILPTLAEKPLNLPPLSLEDAETTIKEPLKFYTPATIRFDSDFLKQTLLPDLASTGVSSIGGLENKTIQPANLQLVCDTLLNETLREKGLSTADEVYVISERTYKEHTTATILGSHLQKQLSEHFPTSEQRKAARTLLKQMVRSDGELLFLRKEDLVQLSSLSSAQVDEILNGLRNGELIEERYDSERQTTYSVGHRFYAKEILNWFDPQEQARHCAQDVLNQAWHSWRATVNAVQSTSQPFVDPGESLLGPDQLRSIRAARQQATDPTKLVAINLVQFCLLLRSAVHYHVDIDYWAQQMHDEKTIKETLAQIHRKRALVSEETHTEEVDLASGAIGLTQADLCQPQALAYTAVTARSGEVRHTAALALASLGMDEVNTSLPVLHTASPKGRILRPIRALAQMKAAGFSLPQLGIFSSWATNLWASGVAARERWAQIACESIGAGVGAGLGVGICFFVLTVVQAFSRGGQPLSLLPLILYNQPLGLFAGLMAVALAWFWMLPAHMESRLHRAVGIITGFMLVVIGIWLPFALLPKYVSLYPPNPGQVQQIIIQHLGGGFLWVLGAVIGHSFGGSADLANLRWRTVLFASIGAALGCGLAIVSGINIPFILLGVGLTGKLLEAFLFGFTITGGLIAGWNIGIGLWQRLNAADLNVYSSV